ncbi:uncharacterized protein L969DRAFT_94065 [Mixia osmundae IAM 14324]|uniref:FMP27 GFWDK domain-containing protein n=1 Tax=Mixia osmundae (strain CBS 9802 / IAM 14324 / JCM 22182 / KY 12970) TaxID=764103 RepID=G7E8Z5_MIXOS|nr:uncharacterized protein L969DRAFT_94065 [Mixia osmundae IAM 14324]KEI40249.1 hypothetical protein L969DRAFT_94065 [Mixia osmundae IAM 14324]GAA99613.1 hypothetical protein E5Q_06314 [Mixia osmundae IAM 14324]
MMLIDRLLGQEHAHMRRLQELPLARWAVYLLLVVIILRTLAWLVAIYAVKGLSIRRTGLLSWRNIVYKLPSTTPGAPARAEIRIRRLGLAIGKSDLRGSYLRWFGLRADDVLVILPRPEAQHNSRPTANGTSTSPARRSSTEDIVEELSTTTQSQDAHKKRKSHSLLVGLLSNTGSLLGQILALLVSLLALEVANVTVRYADICDLEVSVQAGVGWNGSNPVKTVQGHRTGLRERREPFVYVSIRNVKLSACNMSQDPAVRMAGPMLFKASIALERAIRFLASSHVSAAQPFIDAAITFPCARYTAERAGLHIDMLQLEDLLSALKAIRPAQPDPEESLSSRRSSTTSIDSKLSITPRESSEPAKLLQILRSFQFTMPLVRCTLGQPNLTAPTSLVPRLQLHTIHVGVLLGEDSAEHQKHYAWIGRDRLIPLTLTAGFESASLDLLPMEEPARKDIERLKLDRVALHVTSTWLPPSLQAAGIDDIGHIVCEGAVGKLNGDITYEELDALLQHVRNVPRAPHRSRQPKGPPPKPLIELPTLPCIAMGLNVEPGCVLMRGPKRAVMAHWGPGEDDAGTSKGWHGSKPVALHYAGLSLQIDSSSRDHIVRLTERQRRVLRQEARRGGVKAPRILFAESLEAYKEDQTEENPSDDVVLGSDDSGDMDVKHKNRRGELGSQDPDKPDHQAVCTATLIFQIGEISLQIEDGDERGKHSAQAMITRLITIGPISASGSINSDFDYHLATPLTATYVRSSLQGHFDVSVYAFGIDAWKPSALAALEGLIIVGTATSEARPVSPVQAEIALQPEEAEQHVTLVNKLPRNIGLSLCIGNIALRIAGPDPHNDPHVPRGATVAAQNLSVHFILQTHMRILNYPLRQRLQLSDDISLQANSLLTRNAKSRNALVLVTAKELRLEPVADARENSRPSRGMTQDDSPAAPTRAEWELRNREILVEGHRRAQPTSQSAQPMGNDIFYVPAFATRITISDRKNPTEDDQRQDEIVVAVEAGYARMRVDVFHVYCALLAVSTVRGILETIPKTSPAVELTPKSAGSKPAIHARINLSDVHLLIKLPRNVRLFLAARRVELHVPEGGRSVKVLVNRAVLAVESPTVFGAWDDFARIRAVRFEWGPVANNDGWHTSALVVDGDAMRLRIPFKYVISRIIDNVATLIKATKQLIAQFVKGNFQSAIEPKPEGPKRLPQIAISFKIFAMEAQDDPFETRLNIIWRAGHEEQLERLAREGALRERIQAQESELGRQAGYASSDSLDSSDSRPSRDSTKLFDPDKAFRALQTFNSTNWAKRMRNARSAQSRREENLLRRLYDANPNKLIDHTLPINLLAQPRAAPLLRATFHFIDMKIIKHSYGEDKLPKFLHEAGKGLPEDTEFVLLVPFHLSWNMSEARVNLRDYPLPLAHIPRSGKEGVKAWRLETDFVIGEEFPENASIRRVPCEIVAPGSHQPISKGYFIQVPRTAMPTKTYAVPTIKLSSGQPIRFGWGNSLSPAIQDVTRIADTVTKPTPDPSDRIGFWDKIRLILHWKVKVLFVDNGDVCLHLKGGRDPYSLTGFGAGFVLVWRRQVRFTLGHENPEREFFQVKSYDFILAVPDLKNFADSAATGATREKAVESPKGSDDADSDSEQVAYSYDARHRAMDADMAQQNGQMTEFTKVCAKFINGVRWGMGMVMERTCTPHDCSQCEGSPFHRQCRHFDFIPHWRVKTRAADKIERRKDGSIIDSFGGFRSDFVHFSLSIVSPMNTMENANDPRLGYNSMHLTPQGFTHFWAWWGLFESAMSLPIRQGKLFPTAAEPSKKFGKHCATIKYRFSFAPIFIAHTYRQEPWAEWSKGQTTILGVKGKIGRFNADLHQREQEEKVWREDLQETRTALHKAFFQAEVDCSDVDLRAISARFDDPLKQGIVPEDASEDLEDVFKQDAGQGVDGKDRIWLDLDDFEDVNYALPPDSAPGVRLLRTLACPRLTYYRKPPNAEQTQPKNKQHSELTADKSRTSQDTASESEDSDDRGHTLATSKFGSEPSHKCLVGRADGAIDVQIQEAANRLQALQDESKVCRKLLKKLSATDPAHQVQSDKLIELLKREDSMNVLIKRMSDVKDSMFSKHKANGHHASQDSSMPADNGDLGQGPPWEEATMPQSSGHSSENDYYQSRSATTFDDWDRWTNRFMVHNPVLFISNSTRDVLLKYYYSSRQRKGFTYHMTARALRFIRDLMDRHQPERPAHNRRKSRAQGRHSAAHVPTEDDNHVDAEAAHMISQLLGNDQADTGYQVGTRHQLKNVNAEEDAAEGLLDAYSLDNSYLIMLLKPQIALSSELDTASTIVLTAFRAQAKVFSVLDEAHQDDPINSHVMHRSYVTLDGVQVFHPVDGRHPITSAKGALFVPLEVLIDKKLEPWGFDRILPVTSAVMRYDKFNQLRMGKIGVSDSADTSERMRSGHDSVTVEFDKLAVTANPDQFAALYNVVTDLCLYSDPAHKQHSEKLEALLFTHDFSDLAGMTDLVEDLQLRIREKFDVLASYIEVLNELEDYEIREFYTTKAETLRLAGELNILINAITASQDSTPNTKDEKKGTKGIQFDARASELTWAMIDPESNPFAKWSVRGVAFSWLSKRDSTVSNRLVITDVIGLNPNPSHLFPEIISKYRTDGASDNPLVQKDLFMVVLWNTLAPVGGISIIEGLEVRIHPIRLNIEHKLGRKIMDYIFAQRRKVKEISQGEHTIAPEDDEPDEENERDRLLLEGNRSSMSLHSNASSDDVFAKGRQSESRARSYTLSSTNSMPADSHPPTPALAEFSKPHLGRVMSATFLSRDLIDDALDADEMKSRASQNRVFIRVEVAPTILCLSYKGQKDSPLVDMYDLIWKAPDLHRRNVVLSYLELMNAFKKDITRSIWSQSGSLLGQILTSAARKPRHLKDQLRDYAVRDRRQTSDPQTKGIVSRLRILSGTNRAKASSLPPFDGDTLSSASKDSPIASSDSSSPNSGRASVLDDEHGQASEVSSAHANGKATNGKSHTKSLSTSSVSADMLDEMEGPAPDLGLQRTASPLPLAEGSPDPEDDDGDEEEQRRIDEIAVSPCVGSSPSRDGWSRYAMTEDSQGGLRRLSHATSEDSGGTRSTGSPGSTHRRSSVLANIEKHLPSPPASPLASPKSAGQNDAAKRRLILGKSAQMHS